MCAPFLRLECVMPITSFVAGKAYDPETIEIMNDAFLGACAQLGLADLKDAACEIVAKRVIALMDGQRDPKAIRDAVVASFKEPH